MTISLEQARVIIATALKMGVDKGMKPLSVLVVDAGGHPIAFERSEGAPPGRFGIAQGKANACVMMGMSGSALQARAQDPFFTSLASTYGNFLPRMGGVLVRDASGQVVGAVGVTGCTSENDAMAGTAGVEAAGLVAEA